MRVLRYAVACLSLALAPPLWNLAATRWTHRQNPVPGTLHTVGGYPMHLVCTGRGAPTVVLEAAASATWLAWRRVQPRLSEQTQVCSYDRAGHGWSDPRPGVRDADHVVAELHGLLDQAKVARPLVLVGHSAGGLYVRAYASRFPAEVVGVALLDASSPQQADVLPGWRAQYERNVRTAAARLRWERVRVWSGWERLTGACALSDPDEAPEVVGQYAALMCRPAFVGGEENEYADFEATARQTARTRLEGLPLLVVSRDPAGEPDASPEDREFERVWSEEQEKMKTLSARSWRVVARGAGHDVHHDRLDLVVAQLRLLVDHVRGGGAPPFGTTEVS